MYRSLTTFATFFLCGIAAAQSVSYHNVEKPKELAPVKIGVCLAFASGNQISAGGILQGSPIPRLFLHGEYRTGLSRGFSNRGATGTEELVTTQPESKGGYWEAGAGWSIAEDIGKGTFRVTTSSTMTSEHFFHAACDMRKVLTVDGGLLSLKYTYYLGSDSGTYFESSGTRLTPGPDNAMHATVNNHAVFAGLSYRKIRKAAVISDGYRYRRFKATSWSGQVLMGGASMQDIVVAGKTWSISNARSSGLGYRILFRADRGPSSTCVELGKMPHIVFDNDNAPDLSLFGTQGISTFLNYFRLSFNFVLVGNDRRHGLRQKKD